MLTDKKEENCCPNCGIKLADKKYLPGKTYKCSKCKKNFIVIIPAKSIGR